MIRSKKTTGKAVSMPTGLLLGALVSLGITVAGAAITGKLLEVERIAEETVGYAVMILLLVASYAGTRLSQHKIKRQILLVSVLSGVIYFALLLSVTALFFGGEYEAVAVTGLLVMGGCGTALILSGRSGRGRNSKKRGRVSC